jgi:hypothetical protein
MLEAAENINFGDDLIVAAGGKAKKASGVTAGVLVYVLGEAQNTVAIGEQVQVFIERKTYKN